MVDLRNTHYFSGFMDGEGNFALGRDQRRNSYRIAIKITQRLDSRLVLDEIQKVFGGSMSVRTPNPVRTGRGGENPQATLTISSYKSSYQLIDYFDRFPLIGKAAEYKVWRKAVLYYYQNTTGHGSRGHGNSQQLMDEMESLASELKQLRQYDAPTKLSLESGSQQKELCFS